MHIRVIESIDARMAVWGADAEHWLWCSVCRRFFPRARVIVDDAGAACCPFEDCPGVGYDRHIFYWDSAREPKDPRWPASPAELRDGMTSPEMGPFYEAQLAARVERIVGDFREATGRDGRYVTAFLNLLADLMVDPTDPEKPPFPAPPEVYRSPELLPLWVDTKDVSRAQPMADELRCFGEFAARTKAIHHADGWQRALDARDLVARLKRTMRQMVPRPGVRMPARASKRTRRKGRPRRS